MVDPNIQGGFLREFSAKHTTDQNPVKITRMLALSDDRLIVLDYGNKSIKLFSSDYEFINSFVLAIPPQGMTYVATDRIAVAFVSNISFYKITKDDILLLQEDIEILDRLLNDIIYKVDDEFIVSCENRQSEVSGFFIENISSQGTRKTLLKENEKLTINSCLHLHLENLVVIGLRDSLKCFNVDGTPRWRVKISAIRGMISYESVILVVSYMDNAVYQVSGSGQLKTDPVIKRVNNPGMICVQKSRKKILISETNSDTIYVFLITEPYSIPT